MDLGLFRRRRFVFWMWVICPLVLAVVIHYSVYFYSQRMAGMLQEQRAMAGLLPELSGALALSRSVTDTFPHVRATAAEARASLTTRISELSNQHGFLANNVRISSLPAEGAMHRLEVTIDGEGRLLSIMKFVNDLQTTDSLMDIVGTRLRVNAFFPIPVYQCELEFEASFAPAMQSKAGG
jgi:hypothetical protein